MTERHTYLITGGTGFIGSLLTKTLLAQGHKVRSYARNEHGQERLEKATPLELRKNLSCLLGAVEDPARLHRAMRGVDFCIHAAAQKIVPLAEYDPSSCLSTNVHGTRNVLDACIDAGVKRAVFIGTDKASAPSTLYGASKLCAERAWLAANRYSAGHEPHFVGVRYGNVFGSKGSVLEAWQAQSGMGVLSLTDARCTRFHIRPSEAVELVLDALHHASPGELWIPKLPTYRIGDLCHAFRQVFKLERQPAVTGLRLAEKLHESLISGNESIACKTQDSGKYILTPGEIRDKGGWEYTSGMPGHQLGVEELRGEVEAWAKSS